MFRMLYFYSYLELDAISEEGNWSLPWEERNNNRIQVSTLSLYLFFIPFALPLENGVLGSLHLQVIYC